MTPAEFRKVKAGVYYDDYSYGTGTPVGQIKALLGTRGQQSHYAVYGYGDDDPWTWTYRMCGAQHAYNYTSSIHSEVPPTESGEPPTRPGTATKRPAKA